MGHVVWMIIWLGGGGREGVSFFILRKRFVFQFSWMVFFFWINLVGVDGLSVVNGGKP